jgi:hypothetical protein
MLPIPADLAAGVVEHVNVVAGDATVGEPALIGKTSIPIGSRPLPNHFPFATNGL